MPIPLYAAASLLSLGIGIGGFLFGEGVRRAGQGVGDSGDGVERGANGLARLAFLGGVSGIAIMALRDD